MKYARKIVIWTPILLAAIVVSFIMGRITLEPTGEQSLSEFRGSAVDSGEHSAEAARDEGVSDLLSGEHASIESGQTWTLAELSLINSRNHELFLGNTVVEELAMGYELIGQELFPSTKPRHKLLVFPDGNALTVEFELPAQFDETWWHVEDGISPGFFEPLSMAASKGNDAAAHQLYTSLKACEKAPRTLAEFNARENQLRGKYPVEDAEIYVQHDQDLYRRCQGTTEDMMATAIELLRQTGEAGSWLNAEKWALEVQGAQPEVAEAIYRRLWNENGSMSALNLLAGVYSVRQPASYSEAVAAFAYYYAGTMLVLADLDGIVDVDDVREYLIQDLMQLENTASYSVAQAGKALAYRLIAENPNCCR